MKKSMIKITTLVLVIAMVVLCCPLTNVSAVSAVSKPTISITGNNADVISNESGTKTKTIKITISKLDLTKGIDVAIEAPSGFEFGTSSFSGNFYKDGVAVTDLNTALSENNRYTITSSKLRIVTALVQYPADYFVGTVQVSTTSTTRGITDFAINASYINLVNQSVVLMSSSDYDKNGGQFIIGKTAPATYAGAAATSGYFIPYGSVYTKTGGVSADKKSDGTFAIASGKSNSDYNFVEFKLPETADKVTTFSSSRHTDGDYAGVQFASYSNQSVDERGTIIVKGDFDAFCTAQMAKYATQEAVVQRIGELLNSRSNGTWYKISYTFGGTTKTVYIAKIKQTKKMWANGDNFQYALRVYGIKDSATKFTAIGYTKSGSVYTYSNEFVTNTKS